MSTSGALLRYQSAPHSIVFLFFDVLSTRSRPCLTNLAARSSSMTTTPMYKSRLMPVVHRRSKVSICEYILISCMHSRTLRCQLTIDICRLFCLDHEQNKI